MPCISRPMDFKELKRRSPSHLRPGTRGNRCLSSGWRARRSDEALKWSRRLKKRTTSSRSLCVIRSSRIIRRLRGRGTVPNRMRIRARGLLNRVGPRSTQCWSTRDSSSLQKSKSVARVAGRMSPLWATRTSLIQALSSSMMARRSKSERRRERSLPTNRRLVTS